MPKVQYGDATIDYTFLPKEGLAAHYITVEKHKGVVLKGRPIDTPQANQLILQKARWILDKLERVRSVAEGAMVTGSRIPYLVRKYYTQIYVQKDLAAPYLCFNHSKFKIYLPSADEPQATIQAMVAAFYKTKAQEKISPRVYRWAKATGLSFGQLKFLKMEKRWGSCTPRNNIIINTEAIKLPFSLIDYLIVHELCHTKVKNHSKAFWAELACHLPNWKDLDQKILDIKV